MKLATFEVETPVGPVERIGAVLEASEHPAAVAGEATLVDLTAATAARLEAEGEPAPVDLAHARVPPEMIAFLERGDRALADARDALEYASETDAERGPGGAKIRYEPDEYDLLAPLPRPNSLRDCMAIEEHVQNSMDGDIDDVWYDIPVYYKGNADSVVPPNTTVQWPEYSHIMDYELEIAAVIGKRGRDIPADEAEDYITGYTVFNDFSARDMQGKEMDARLGPAKGKDFANGLGPYVVPADDIDVLEAPMTARIDGEVWSEGTVDEMYHSFADIIAHISQSETLHPGDVIGSGTVGEGCGLELGQWLEDGSTVELEIEGIGVLEHTVVE
ncbi:fumarylacetoacetate hydrolase family protein [Natronorubrum daqingense]|uniref:2-hydroxyhepta-2,4-diene-1,7-dioate isomerase n=1 Tax=Natronorubrum daqingense TaxID=588898 RepID=A0A1N7AI04_9EURY|nr:fumarylacetoacetate hydrolase family protein [Natronorubrum daqingense]APX97977.1 2-hydroxyhepta-2,4-diene-1,7-dioate isomerase [Natronorubrum daqingense]SIR38603.1 2-keto-4-pentenoate hydratase/2-oxohepta-3-ene-1,7-dioic acid hydratase (catechol pathway) [Natronorubrum daqingense]